MLELRGLTSLLSSLGAGVGDQLCFEPAGRLAAKATLIKAAAAAGAAGGRAAGPRRQAALPARAQQQDEPAEEEGGDAPPLPLNSSAAAPGQRQPSRRGGRCSWRGLEPADTGHYSLVLSSRTVNNEHRAWIPGRLPRKEGGFAASAMVGMPAGYESPGWLAGCEVAHAHRAHLCCCRPLRCSSLSAGSQHDRPCQAGGHRHCHC